MGNLFRRMKLSEIGQIVAGGTPKTKIEEYWNGDVPWITPKDLSSHAGMYISRGERNISQVGLDNSSAKLLPKGTVLFTSRAPIGYVAIARNEVTTNQGFKSIISDDENDNIFIYYLLKNNIDLIENHANGSTFKEISGSVMKSLEFGIPSLREQKAIAHILSTLDEKIEVNNQINKTLENMAQAIFKQWFVDFEFPNEDGEPYKSSGGEMVESELGKIPKGWKVSKVGELTDIVSKGTTPRKSDIDSAPDNSCVNFLKVKDISDNGVIDLKGLELIPSSVHLNQLKRSILKYKDVLISIAGTIGKISYVNEELVNANTNQAVAFIRLKNVDKHFLLLHYKFKSSNFQDSIKSKIVQGVQANISLSVIKGEKLILPEDNLLGLYNNILNNIFNKSNILCKEINSLTNIRDALLPKLMSGEIRVPLNEEGDAS